VANPEALGIIDEAFP